MSLAQLAVDEKSNEITAVSKLLDLEGHTVSLDAMGCQKAIAQKICLAKADYFLALKGSHVILHKRVEETFSSPEYIKYIQNQDRVISHIDITNKGHGRKERRIVKTTDSLDFIDKKERESWLGKGNAAQNVALLGKLALNLLKADTSVKDTVRGERLQATFSETVLGSFLRLTTSK